MKKLILSLFLVCLFPPIHAQEAETPQRITQNSLWSPANRLDLKPTEELPYRYAIGAYSGGTLSSKTYNRFFFLQAKYTTYSNTNASSIPNPADGEKSHASVGNDATSSKLYYKGSVMPIVDMVMTEDGYYNIAVNYQVDASTVEKRWIGYNGKTSSYLYYVNSEYHASDPNNITTPDAIADLTLKWKENSDGTGYYQIWWGNKILKIKKVSLKQTLLWYQANCPCYCAWSETKGGTTEFDAKLFMAKKAISPDKNLVTVGLTPDINSAIPTATSTKIYLPNAPNSSYTSTFYVFLKSESGNVYVPKNLNISTNFYTVGSSLSNYYSKESLKYEWSDDSEYMKFDIPTPVVTAMPSEYESYKLADMTLKYSVAFDPNLSDTEALLSATCTHTISFYNAGKNKYNKSWEQKGYGTRQFRYSPNPSISSFRKVIESSDEFTLCPLVPDETTAGLTRDENGTFSFINHPRWEFPGSFQMNDVDLVTFPDGILVDQGTTYNFSVFAADKPKFIFFSEAAAYKSQDSKSNYLFRIPKGAFEPGTATEHYARVVLTPQFDTFRSAQEAEDFYGIAPNESSADSWLSGEWYEGNGLEGFMPEMQWDEEKQEYFCELNGHDMTYVDHEGNRSEGNTLVSGHYKAKIVPSLGENDRQYGIVASDPVDIFIYPSLYDMKMHLCVRDDKDGDPRWEPYDISNEDFSFEGPKATDDGETAYRHARLQPAADFCEVWVESPRHRPAYPEGQIPGQKPAEKTARKAAPRAALVSGDLTGYTKVEPDDYIDLSGTKPVNIKLVKNGVASPAQAINVVKTGDEIVTGIDELRPDQLQADAEYFTPAGLRVANPTLPGIYIERRASKARKIILR